MLEVLSKPLGEITTADIQSLIDEKVPEGERIEFKRGLPAAKGKTDPWMDGRDEIRDYAKNNLVCYPFRAPECIKLNAAIFRFTLVLSDLNVFT